MRALHAAMVGMCIAGCADPLIDPQTVIGLRLLATRVAPVEQPTRATVRPGESATQRWLIVSDEPRTYNGLAVWCEGSPSSVGVPPCRAPFEKVEVEGNSNEPLVMNFTLPDSLSASAGWVHRLGICETSSGSGKPPRWLADVQEFDCPEGELVSGVYRGDSKQDNRHPNLQDDLLELDGDRWPELETSVAPECGAPGVVDVSAEEEVVITFESNGGDREELEDDSYAAPQREALSYTHVTNWPGLQRAYSVIDDAASSSGFEVRFRSERDVPPKSAGELVRYDLTVRDGRGGADWLERWFCLRP